MLAQVKQNWPYAEQMGLADNASLENLTFTTDLKEAVKEVEHIQENVPEVEEIKDTVLREIDFMHHLMQQLAQVLQELCLQNYRKFITPRALSRCTPIPSCVYLATCRNCTW